MRAPDSEYDPRRWQEGCMRRSPRRWWTRWAILLGLIVMIGWSVAVTLHPTSDIAPGLGGAMIPLILATSFSPFARQRWLTRRALAGYDEYERAAISDAALRSYNIFLLVVLAVVIWLTAFDVTRMPPRSTLVTWAMTLLTLGVSLPTLVAEWTVPFPDAEDQPL